MAVSTFRLREFLLDKSKYNHPIILACGMKGSGKSVAVKGITAQFPEYERWVVFTGNRDAKYDWKTAFGSTANIFSADDAGIAKLEEVIGKQDRYVGRARFLGKPLENRKKIAFIFDDIGGHEHFLRHKIFKDLFSNNRHYECLAIFTSQSLTQFPLKYRQNVDIIIMTYNQPENRKRLHSDYVKGRVSLAEFEQLLITVTEQCNHLGKKLYNALVFEPKTPGLSEAFSILRPFSLDDLEKIRLGSEEFRRYLQQIPDEDEERIKLELLKEVQQNRVKTMNQRQQMIRSKTYPGTTIYPSFHDNKDEDMEKELLEQLGDNIYYDVIELKNGTTVSVPQPPIRSVTEKSAKYDLNRMTSLPPNLLLTSTDYKNGYNPNSFTTPIVHNNNNNINNNNRLGLTNINNNNNNGLTNKYGLTNNNQHQINNGSNFAFSNTMINNNHGWNNNYPYNYNNGYPYNNNNNNNNNTTNNYNPYNPYNSYGNSFNPYNNSYNNNPYGNYGGNNMMDMNNGNSWNKYNLYVPYNENANHQSKNMRSNTQSNNRSNTSMRKNI